MFLSVNLIFLLTLPFSTPEGDNVTSENTEKGRAESRRNLFNYAYMKLEACDDYKKDKQGALEECKSITNTLKYVEDSEVDPICKQVPEPVPFCKGAGFYRRTYKCSIRIPTQSKFSLLNRFPDWCFLRSSRIISLRDCAKSFFEKHKHHLTFKRQETTKIEDTQQDSDEESVIAD